MNITKLEEVNKDINSHLNYNWIEAFLIVTMALLVNFLLIFFFIIFIFIMDMTVLKWLDLNWISYLHGGDGYWTPLFYQLFFLLSLIFTPIILCIDSFDEDDDMKGFLKKIITLHYPKLLYFNKLVFIIKAIKNKKTNKKRKERLDSLKNHFKTVNDDKLFLLYKSLNPKELNINLLDIIENEVEKRLDIKSKEDRVSIYITAKNKNRLHIKEMIND